MKVKYIVIRVFANEYRNDHLQKLENTLNAGYMIERVEEIHSTENGKPSTHKDYILFKLENEENER